LQLLIELWLSIVHVADQNGRTLLPISQEGDDAVEDFIRLSRVSIRDVSRADVKAR